MRMEIGRDHETKTANRNDRGERGVLSAANEVRAVFRLQAMHTIPAL